jgi:hypothetical protein
MAVTFLHTGQAPKGNFDKKRPVDPIGYKAGIDPFFPEQSMDHGPACF